MVVSWFYLHPELALISVGGFASGEIYASIYQPDQFVLNSVANGSPVIYVAMNYRLGGKSLKSKSEAVLI
jgi:carboxylesterase type B